jgi:hypothetical protein
MRISALRFVHIHVPINSYRLLYMKSSFIIFIGIIVIGAGWYFLSPLVINTEVNEEFPESKSIPKVPTAEELAEMSPEQLLEIKEETMTITATIPDTAVGEKMPDNVSTEPIVLKKGIFMDADSFHKGSGIATVYELPDAMRIVRFEDFSVTNGPDLRVLLVSHSNPKTSEDITQGDYIELDRLKGNRGNQNYVLPADVDIEQYKSIVIYCKPFHVVFATAPLQ